MDEDETAAGDQLLANTPEWRANLAATYSSRGGFDLGVNFRYSSGFPWAAGVFAGYIESGSTFDANAGYRISPTFRVCSSPEPTCSTATGSACTAGR